MDFGLEERKVSFYDFELMSVKYLIVGEIII